MVQNVINLGTRYRIVCAFQYPLFRSIVVKFYSDGVKNKDTVTENKNKDSVSEQSLPTLPEPPTTCCMSGCANCVWIEYAEKLTQHFKDGGEKARKHILETVTDGNMRAFLLMELRTMKLK